MKRIRLTCVLAAIMIAMAAIAQSPVKWTATAKMTTATEGLVTLTAAIDEGWHMYGTKATDDGPIPTRIVFGGSAIKYASKTYCKPSVVEMEDPVFGCTVTYWENKVTFTRKFTITDPAKAKVTVKVSYMCCNDSNCFPPTTEEFTPTIEK